MLAFMVEIGLLNGIYFVEELNQEELNTFFILEEHTELLSLILRGERLLWIIYKA